MADVGGGSPKTIKNTYNGVSNEVPPEKACLQQRIIGENLSSILSSAGAEADYIMICDTNHQSSSIRSQFSSPEFLQGLAEAGVTDIAVEFPKELDGFIDRFANEEIDRQTFVQEVSARTALRNDGEMSIEDASNHLADLIENAERYGMRVHGVDPGDPELDRLEAFGGSNIINEKMQAYAQSEGIDIPPLWDEGHVAFREAFEGSEYAQQAITEYTTLRDGYLMDRMIDETLAENIEDINGGKVAIIYGSGHNDLARRLEGEPMSADATGGSMPQRVFGNRSDVLVVDVSTSPEAYMAAVDIEYQTALEGAQYSNEYTRASYDNGQADIVICTESGDAFTTNYTYGAFTDQFTMQDAFTREEPGLDTPVREAPAALSF